jgi:hypothetical protein
MAMKKAKENCEINCGTQVENRYSAAEKLMLHELSARGSKPPKVL